MFDTEIKFDDSGFSYKWHGGTLVSVYEQLFNNVEPVEIDCFTVNALGENKDWNIAIREMKQDFENRMNSYLNS
jgi:hypothetical protein